MVQRKLGPEARIKADLFFWLVVQVNKPIFAYGLVVLLSETLFPLPHRSTYPFFSLRNLFRRHPKRRKQESRKKQGKIMRQCVFALSLGEMVVPEDGHIPSLAFVDRSTYFLQGRTRSDR